MSRVGSMYRTKDEQKKRLSIRGCCPAPGDCYVNMIGPCLVRNLTGTFSRQPFRRRSIPVYYGRAETGGHICFSKVTEGTVDRNKCERGGVKEKSSFKRVKSS